MILSYKFRLFPNRAQRAALEQTLTSHQQLYNAALEERREAYRKQGIGVTYKMQSGQLKALRREVEEVGFLNFSAMQQTLRRLDKAFTAFFERIRRGDTPGFPRFKSRARFNSVCYVYGDGIRLKDERLYVQNVGLLRLFQHRPLPAGATVKMVVLKRDGVGNWFAVLQTELPDPLPAAHSGPAVGIDMGLEYFATLSNGEHVDNPRWYRQQEERLGVLQRRRARCQRGSRQYRELTRLLRKTHEKIANIRRDFHHKASRLLVDTYSLIAVERLNIKGLARSHVAKSMQDAGWAHFLFCLSYKAENAGAQVVEVHARHTSQVCSGCGVLVPKALNVRWHECPDCGLSVQRDVNAALNVLSRAAARTEPPCKVLLQR